MGLLNHQNSYTNIKICGLSKEQDILVANSLAIEAIGFVFYPPSPRYVSPQQALQLGNILSDEIQIVALVVDPSDELIQEIRSQVRVDIWQFHGDESPARCAEIAQATPWMKAARIDDQFVLQDFCLQYSASAAWILDAVVEGFGGGGQTFNWQLIPDIWIKENAHRVVLSGGLNSHNVAEAIAHFRPLGVDISSGVEASRGNKEPNLMQQFVDAVRSTDQYNSIKGS
ncbi:phosphoribosylanthranilate isomerase [Polynucleobacter kasalickyi]|uniref:N-(5'-phosphoribosyl)anthranilate isomerase n=1 Tax=Polynucleobacter kasalickyi TaxID=1938817 RepID=A0A1W1ZDN4_9BURK|nr:phosphoribosylanthranilate isomerase [Polynucleobacter kasalickyi]SMC46533.1 phosphoribosylanthranilate isomerase [Polynucleobacter kasalickyi]